MKNLLLELEELINKATSDYKNKTWSRYEIYCAHFNKILAQAVSNFKDISITPFETHSSLKLHNTPDAKDAYNMLADRVKLKEFIDKASSLFATLNSFPSQQQSIESSNAPVRTLLSPLDNIHLVCNNFCSVVRELRRRSDNGPTFEINNTGDMIYLFKALLRLHFDAIFEDVWEAYDDITQTMLIIPTEKTVIIPKKTLKTTTDTSLMNDFLQAIEYYGQNTSYNNIFYFIYDPELRISQPAYLEEQLHALNRKNLNIKIFIKPIT